MVPNETLNDLDDRRRAVKTPHHAFVWASAGTGKTHTLTLRAIYLLLYGPFLHPARPPSDHLTAFADIAHLYHPSDRRLRLKAARATIRSLVLTTFTRKAAAEMQTRLYAYLDALASAAEFSQLAEIYRQDPLFLEICRELLQELGTDEEAAFARLKAGAEALAETACEFHISTLHSLAARLLGGHPLESGIPAGMRFAEENEDDFGDLDDRLVREWWQTEALKRPDLQDALKTLLSRLSPYHIREWFKKAYRHPQILEQIQNWVEPPEATRRLIIEAFRELGEKLAGNGGKRIAANGKKLIELSARLEAGDLQAWPDTCVFLCDTRNSLFLNGSKPSEAVKSAVAQLPSDLAWCFQTLFNAYTPCARMALLKTFVDEWHIWKRILASFLEWVRCQGVASLGIVGFDEMIRLAADLLERHPEVQESEARRLRALLVDEFQDTDPEQLRFITGLLRRSPESEHEIIAFFVGDTKQSIYRFRGADVEATVRFHDDYAQLTRCRLPVDDLSLTSTFRSLPTITGFLNHLFSARLDLCAEPKDRLQPVRKESGEVPEWIWIDRDEAGESLDARTSRRLAASETANLINEYVFRKGGRFREVLVLVKTARELDALLPVLQESGIPVISSGARTLYRQPEVSDVLNLFIALLNPLDTLAVGAILRSPLVQLSDPEIHELIQAAKPERLLHSADSLPGWLPEPARQRLEELRRLVLARPLESLSDWLLEVRAFLPLAAYTDSFDLEGRPHARINRVFEAFLAEIKADKTPPLAWLLKQRARAGETSRFDANLGEDVSVADDSIDAVRVMTIHKAKGLESRFTIVYGWSTILTEMSPSRVSLKGTLVLPSGRRPSGVEFWLPFGPMNVCSDHLDESLAAEAENCGREAVRLAYVASTRARDQLSLVCAVPVNMRLPDQFSELCGLASRSHGSAGSGEKTWDETVLVRPASTGDKSLRSPSVPSLPLDREQYRTLWERRREEVRSAAGFPLARPSLREDQDDAIQAGEPPAGRDSQTTETTRLETGRLVHAYLERWLPDGSFDPGKLALLGMRLSPANTEALTQADSCLQLFYSDRMPDRGGPLFSYHARARRAEILGREVPFYMSLEEKYWNGVIDLVIEENGIILGVDYKTSQEKDELPASYAQQARVYTEALKRLFPGRLVDFEFWWMVPAEPGRRRKR